MYLWCQYSNETYKCIFYENNSISYVVKNNGTVILHPQQDRLSRNIYELLKQDNDIKDVNQLKNN